MNWEVRGWMKDYKGGVIWINEYKDELSYMYRKQRIYEWIKEYNDEVIMNNEIGGIGFGNEGIK